MAKPVKAFALFVGKVISSQTAYDATRYKLESHEVVLSTMLKKRIGF